MPGEPLLLQQFVIGVGTGGSIARVKASQKHLPMTACCSKSSEVSLFVQSRNSCVVSLAGPARLHEMWRCQKHSVTMGTPELSHNIADFMLEGRALISAVHFAGLLGQHGSDSGEAVHRQEQPSLSGSEHNVRDLAHEDKPSGATMANVMRASLGEPERRCIETGRTAALEGVQIQEVRRPCGIIARRSSH